MNSSKKHLLAETPKMSFLEKFGFAAFSTSNNICFQFKSLYYMFFLTNVLGISIATAGTVFAIGTVWDAVNDPLIGYAALNHKFKNGEKIRPYILTSVPWAVSIVLLFTPFGGSEAMKAVLALIIYFIFEALNTYCGIPYNGMGAVATNRDEDRRSLNAYRNIGGCMGTAVGALACLPLLKLLGAMDQKGNLSSGAKLGFMEAAAIMGAICIIGALIHYFTTKERVYQVEESDERISFKEVIRMLFSYGSFVRNTIYIVCYGCINALLLTCITYYATYVLGSTAAATPIQAAYLVVSLGMTFVVGIIDRKFGRRKTMMIGAAFYIISKIWFIIDPSNPASMYVNAAATGVGVSISFVMFNTNRNNIVDLVEDREGKRLDSMVATVDNLVAKLAQSLVTWFMGIFLAHAGFDAALAVQPESVKGALTFLLGWAPMIIGAIMLINVTGFKIEKEFNELKQRRQQI